MTLRDRSILITVGTGSFGNQFTEAILNRYPDIQRLVIYSRDELKQFEMAQRTIQGCAFSSAMSGMRTA